MVVIAASVVMVDSFLVAVVFGSCGASISASTLGVEDQVVVAKGALGVVILAAIVVVVASLVVFVALVARAVFTSPLSAEEDRGRGVIGTIADRVVVNIAVVVVFVLFAKTV